MKRILLLIFVALLYCNSVQAYAHMNEKMIEMAQEYGIMNYQKELPDFAKSWVIYEENTKTLDVMSERAYVYTPYYLVAVNARERLLSSQPITVSDGKLIIDAFNGILPVCVVLYLKDTKDLDLDLVALLRQKGKLLEAYSMQVQDMVVIETKIVQEKLVTAFSEEYKNAEKEQKTAENELKNHSKAKEKEDDEKNNKDKKKNKDKDKKKNKDKDNDNDKDKDKDKDKSKDKNDDDKKNSEDNINKIQPIYIEKMVPSLYRVQIFLYFDMKHIDVSDNATLLIDLEKEHERRFNFSFASLR